MRGRGHLLIFSNSKTAAVPKDNIPGSINFEDTIYNNNHTMVDLMERLEILLDQETSAYRTEDYLAPDFQRSISQQDAATRDVPLSSSTLSLSATSSSAGSGINEGWRERICKWSYQVVDHFDLSREVVTVSIHYLDRYLATRVVNKKIFQLVAMTTLYIAIKLYEPGTLSMKSMIDLSRGFFTVEQMEEMEMDILRSLSWRVHPPTAYCFTKHILFLLSYTSVNIETRYEVLELSRFLCELSVFDYFFVIQRPSSVGLASLLNATESVPGVSSNAVEEMKSELSRIPGLDPNSVEVQECRDRLRMLYTQGGYSAPTPAEEEPRIETTSPVCVSYGVTPCDSYQPKHSFDYTFSSGQE